MDTFRRYLKHYMLVNPGIYRNQSLTEPDWGKTGKMRKRHQGTDFQTNPPKSFPPPLNGSLQITIKGSPITALKNLTWREQNQGSLLCKGKRQKNPTNPSLWTIQMLCGTPYSGGGQGVVEHPACALQFSKLLATLMKRDGMLVRALCYLQRCLLLELVYAW